MERVEFFFDLASPVSYLASTQLEGFSERTGAEVQWRPFLLGGVFKATGNRSPIYTEVANKRAYIDADLPAWAEHYGVPFRFPSVFPTNSLTAMRGAIAAQRLGRLLEYARAGFRAHFADDEDLADIAVLERIAEHAGIDRAEFLALIEDPEVKQALKAATDEAVARGAFGAPTFFWRDCMFFGNDRLGLLEATLRKNAKR